MVATARDASTLADLAAEYPDTALALSLDVTDAGHIQAAVERGTGRFGAIDVLVNNAGYGYRAAVEEGDDTDVRTLFDTHFFGTVDLIKAVLPQMRARRTGTIVNLSSIGARITPAGSGYYAAAKAAVEGLTGSLRKELEPLGITAMVVEPGGFRTDFSGRSLQQSAEPIHDYADTAGKRRKENDTSHGTQPGDPAKAAAAIITAVSSAEAPEVLVLGADATTAHVGVLQAQLASLEAWRHVSESTAVAE
ncbi:SDR family NAD(P)-dependent oxidoreductase [Arthrobacter agilis]|uniref:SDR family NAD(P)-dependent oxidoreductase n=1 Tax=Arthrobacter agilis TaxID=37921 RepID=UPI002787A389|nr:SDR family NAD(P)-dependent oxidoreductase [Arthrobacter agilis]MDQ0736846.1 NAD(P)-dependent dehydrogenase (short-subunit alcohol dehydrogenase family) [Arthrobacter agilis]